MAFVEFDVKNFPCSFIYDKDEDAIYLHKGVDLNYIGRLLGNVTFVNDQYHDYKEMKFEYEEIVPPRNNEQVDVINFIAGLAQFSGSIQNRQLFLVKKPGFG